MRYTLGFEIEAFVDMTRFSRYLARLGFSQVYTDPSGPWETQSPVIEVSGDSMPLPILYPSLMLDYSREQVLDTGLGSAGTHHHVAIKGEHDMNDLRSLYLYLAAHIPVMLPFLVRKSRLRNNYYHLRTTRERYRWAATPLCSMSYSRQYWAITYNPSGSFKPVTLEIRICETAPHLCSAAIVVMLAGYESSVFARKIPPYPADKIPLRIVNSYVGSVLDHAKIPYWARRIAEILLSSEKRPVTITGLLSRRVIGLSDIEALMNKLGVTCSELGRTGMLGQRLARLICS